MTLEDMFAAELTKRYNVAPPVAAKMADRLVCVAMDMRAVSRNENGEATSGEELLELLLAGFAKKPLGQPPREQRPQTFSESCRELQTAGRELREVWPGGRYARQFWLVLAAAWAAVAAVLLFKRP